MIGDKFIADTNFCCDLWLHQFLQLIRSSSISFHSVRTSQHFVRALSLWWRWPHCFDFISWILTEIISFAFDVTHVFGLISPVKSNRCRFVQRTQRINATLSNRGQLKYHLSSFHSKLPFCVAFATAFVLKWVSLHFYPWNIRAGRCQSMLCVLYVCARELLMCHWNRSFTSDRAQSLNGIAEKSP